MTQKELRSQSQNYKNQFKILQTIPINKLAKASGFKQRKSQKIGARELLLSFFIIAVQGKNTFEQWAQQIGILTNNSLSRQGLFNRVNASLVDFLWKVLQHCFKEQFTHTSAKIKLGGNIARFKEIMINDSTVICLPHWLNWCYPGNVSGGKKKSQLKIQITYGVLTNKVLQVDITPYTKNDQSQAEQILKIADKRSLVIRDLGYFTLTSLEKMKHQGVPFISLLRYGVKIFDAKTNDQIDLSKVLKKKGFYDGWVHIGKSNQVPVRLVAIKLSKEQASRRRRYAKRDRDRRLNHDKKYYELLGYKIFITSQEREYLTRDEIIKLYQIRWRIESIFKTWKSAFNLQQLIPKNRSITKERVDATILMMLIFILLVQFKTYRYMISFALKRKMEIVSIYKLSQYIAGNLHFILLNNMESIANLIAYHCRYDKRKDRLNYDQKLEFA